MSQEKSYRDLFANTVASIREGRYSLNDVFEMRAPLTMANFFSAIASWSVFPVYLGLVAVYAVADVSGWLDSLTGLPS